MKMSSKLIVALSVLIALPFSVTEAESANDPIAAAKAARILFRDRCSECHSGDSPDGDLPILDHGYLIENTYAVAKDVDGSMIWQKIHDEEEPMPPKGGGKPLSESEVKIIRDWIEAGAPPFPAEQTRKFISEFEVLGAIVNDLQDAEPGDRPFMRYFSLVNLHNNSFEKRVGANSKNVDDDELNHARAGLSILLNSLSWEHKIAVPRAIKIAGRDDGAAAVLYRIDLRDYGWSHVKWLEAIASPGTLYPYGIDYRYHHDKKLKKLAEQHFMLRAGDHIKGRALPYVRADWFINTASRGDLYYRLLELPDNVAKLERDKLHVDSRKNFVNRRVKRAGMIKSGVSQHNRLVERHDTSWGAYWKSYDFSDSREKRNLRENPLGPAFPHNPFGHLAFVEDGGEMIFNLPNDLQAYYLAAADGVRINEGPTNIVEDNTGASGSVVVTNAISCFACHDRGMKTFKDIIRTNHRIGGAAGAFIDDLYIPSKEMDAVVNDDAVRFQRAVLEAIKPWFPDVTSTEPVSSVAKKYHRELQLEEVAVELGESKPDELKRRIKENPDLNAIMPVVDGGQIKRANWESEIFPSIIPKLELGTPIAL